MLSIECELRQILIFGPFLVVGSSFESWPLRRSRVRGRFSAKKHATRWEKVIGNVQHVASTDNLKMDEQSSELMEYCQEMFYIMCRRFSIKSGFWWYFFAFVIWAAKSMALLSFCCCWQLFLHPQSKLWRFCLADKSWDICQSPGSVPQKRLIFLHTDIFG